MEERGQLVALKKSGALAFLKGCDALGWIRTRPSPIVSRAVEHRTQQFDYAVRGVLPPRASDVCVHLDDIELGDAGDFPQPAAVEILLEHPLVIAPRPLIRLCV